MLGQDGRLCGPRGLEDRKSPRRKCSGDMGVLLRLADKREHWRIIRDVTGISTSSHRRDVGLFGDMLTLR